MLIISIHIDNQFSDETSEVLPDSKLKFTLDTVQLTLVLQSNA